MSLQKLSIALLLTAGLASTAAHARDGEKPYVGLDYNILKSEYDFRSTFTPTLGTQGSASGSVDSEPYAITVKAGSVLAKYLAIEAHAAFGVRGDNYRFQIPTAVINPAIDATTADARSELDTFYGVYVRPQISLGDVVDLYALVGYGYTRMKFTIPVAGIKIDEDNTGISYGVGAQLNLGSNWAINGSYLMLNKSDDVALVSTPVQTSQGQINRVQGDMTLESINVGIVYRF